MTNSNQFILEAESLYKTYKIGRTEIYAVSDISIKIEPGRFYSFVGPSGSGKSTLLNLLGFLDFPTRGSLKIQGEPSFNQKSLRSSKRLSEIRRKYFGFVFQNFYLLPTLNVFENIALPLLFLKRKIVATRVREILVHLGLATREKHLPSQLSLGEMQRVAIGRALVTTPKIIIADEPTGNLDSKNALMIFELFKDLLKQGITILTATHDTELAEAFSDEVIRIKDGKIITY